MRNDWVFWFTIWGLMYFAARTEQSKRGKVDYDERIWLMRQPGVDY